MICSGMTFSGTLIALATEEQYANLGGTGLGDRNARLMRLCTPTTAVSYAQVLHSGKLTGDIVLFEAAQSHSEID